MNGGRWSLIRAHFLISNITTMSRFVKSAGYDPVSRLADFLGIDGAWH